MLGNHRLQSMRPLAVFLVVFSLFLTVGIILSAANQRAHLLETVDAHLEHETALLEAVIHADLLKHDLTKLQSDLTMFGTEDRNITQLSVTAENGSVLAGYAREQPLLSWLYKTRRISYDNGSYVTLELVYDTGPDEKGITAAGRRDIALSIVFAAIMGAGIWLVLRRTAFMPLESAVRERDQLNATLEQRIAERTTELMTANAVLQQEIVDRTAVEQELLVKERAIAASIEALRMSEARYRMIVENISEIIYMISFEGDAPHGVVVFVGGQVETIVGYRGMDFLSDPNLWISLIHPDDRASVRETTRSLLASGKGGTREYRMRSRSTGEYLWLEDKMVPQVSDNGVVTSYFGVARDITLRKEAETAAQQNITNHKKAEEESRQSYYAQFAISTLLQLSLEDMGLDDILKRALDIILATPWVSFESVGGIFLAEGAPPVLVLKVAKGGGGKPRQVCSRVPFGACLCGRAAAASEMVFAREVDERHELVCGDWGPHGNYCQPIFSGGHVIGVITVMLKAGHERNSKEEGFLNAVAFALAGMIERKRVEDERRKLIIQIQATMRDIFHSKREWQETFDSISDMISIHDEKLRIVKANRAYARYFGLTPKEVINKKCDELFLKTTGVLPTCPQSEALARNQPVSQDATDPDSGRTFHVTTFPYVFPDSDARGVIHVARDITQEREREMRLIMSERLASLGQLASGVAHEINNPLAAMGGCVDGLIRRIRKNEYDPEVFMRYLAIVKDEIARSKGITTDMLSFVRKSSYERSSLDLHAVLDKTLEIIGFQGRLKTVSVVRSYDAGLRPVNGSEGELRQVFLSIITNAIDAMDGKGELVVATGTEEQSVWVVISDTGPGIPAIHHGRIFDPFFTTKAETGGTGLGLAIAARIITGYNGSIRVQENAPGAAIKITLPVA